MDGEFNGESLYFKYKNAKLIKTYLDNKKQSEDPQDNR